MRCCRTIQRKIEAWNIGLLFNKEMIDGETWKVAGRFTLLKRITRLKLVNSESDRCSHFLPRKVYSPKGSCHPVESDMSCTLAHADLSYRIVMWNASDVQEHQQLCKMLGWFSSSQYGHDQPACMS
jgi:hypothetical protein